MTHARKPKPGVKRINLGLQGGGAHGAFTWGVLDRLLEDERIEIEAISGASAGAMNAVVVAEGLAEGGRAQARAQLSDFWESVSNALAASPLNSSLWSMFLPPWLRDFNPSINPAMSAFEMFTTIASPFHLAPHGYNPLRDIIEREVNFDRVHACATMKLFISATRVDTGGLKVFTGNDVSLDALLASACLPTLYKAVEIDGVAYWDGGYVANPPLTPFINHCASSDIMIVQINPARRAEVPQSNTDVLHRLNEITFNASLIREIDSITFVNDLIDGGKLTASGYRRMYLHRLGGGVTFEKLAGASKFNGDWTFLKSLRDAGRTETETWLKEHFDDIGRVSTMEA